MDRCNATHKQEVNTFARIPMLPMLVIMDAKNETKLIARNGTTGPPKEYTSKNVTGRKKPPIIINELIHQAIVQFS